MTDLYTNSGESDMEGSEKLNLESTKWAHISTCNGSLDIATHDALYHVAVKLTLALWVLVFCGHTSEYGDYAPYVDSFECRNIEGYSTT